MMRTAIHLLVMAASVLMAPILAFIVFSWTGDNDESAGVMILFMFTGWPLIWWLVVQDINRNG